MKLPMAFLFLATAIASAQSEWPQFRGPDGRAVARDDQPAPVEFGLERHVLWKSPLPSGISSPVIWGDRVFLTAHDRARRVLETICLRRKTGEILWRHDAPAREIEGVHPVSSPASATPATDGESVYVYFGSCGLTAYDFSGNVRWQKPLPLAITRFSHGSGTSPILASGQLMLDVHQGQESHLLAVDCRDGKTMWQAPKPVFNDGWSSPVSWREDDREWIGMMNAGKFTAHELKTGREAWWVHGIPNQICATPAFSEGVLYLTGTGVLGERSGLITPPSFEELVPQYDADNNGRISTDEMPEALLVADRQASGGVGNMMLRQALLIGANAGSRSFNREEWAAEMKRFQEFIRGDFMKTSALAVRTGGTGDVTDSRVLWTESKGVPEVPSPLLYRGRLYFVRNGGLFTCRDTATGKVVFEERLNAAGGYYASPVAAGGFIYVASDRGVVSVIRAADKLEIRAQIDLREPIMATPALANGQLYIRTAAQLLAFGF